MVAGAAEVRSLMARSRDVVVLAAVIGAAAGVGVAAFDRLTLEVLFHNIADAPTWLIAIGPAVGLGLAALTLRHLGRGASPSTTDEYIKAVPDHEVPFDLRAAPARIIASITTLGLGGAMGYEGPSIFIGTTVGAGAFERVRGWLRGVDRRAALVAGAAAGVAAIFKAPATGAVFALEVPYQEDLARHSLLPALVGAASGYTTYVAINGTEPLIPVAGNPPIDLRDLGYAALIGITCGIGARVFALVIKGAKALAERLGAVTRVATGGAVLGALAVISMEAFDAGPLALGPGYSSVEFALDPSRGLWIVVALATIRAAATAATVAGGGAGGLFVPLVVQGALTGRVLAGVFDADNHSLFVVLGIAAFLGAGYRVPLAAVMFVAEATGRPGFVVPGLIAATIAQIVMGKASVSSYQRRMRVGFLEERADLPIAEVLSTDPAVARPDDTVALFFAEHVSLARRRAVPLVDDDGVFLGLVTLDDVLALDHETWADTQLSEVSRHDVPRGSPGWNLGQALRAMVDGDVDHLPIVDDSGHLRGMVTSDAILDRSRLMDRLEPDD